MLGVKPTAVGCPVPSWRHRIDPYPLPQTVRLGVRDGDLQGAKLTPPPTAVRLLGEDGHETVLFLAADRGWHRWTFVEFRCRPDAIEVVVDFEGHTDSAQAARHLRLDLIPVPAGQSWQAVMTAAIGCAYPAAIAARRVPAWWRRPIYCGWGDQVAASLACEGVGPEPRALAYCTQGLYEKWIGILDAADVPIGTVIIDAGWSPGGDWTPYPNLWPDLRGFIDRQRRRGRRVLLWIGAWLHEGLPDAWCIHAGSRRLTVDPGHPDYRRYLRDQTRRLLDPGKGGFNADGFKIDQLGYTPTERDPRGSAMFGRSIYLNGRRFRLTTRGKTWGCDLLREWQQTVHDAAKEVKPDALINSSTAHPDFAETFDMVRLHDTGPVNTDVFAAMRARADLARIALPNHLIDTDNWVHTDYRKWLDYTRRGWQLGVPCLFYAERFVLGWDREPVVRPIALRDLRAIGRIWKNRAG